MMPLSFLVSQIWFFFSSILEKLWKVAENSELSNFLTNSASTSVKIPPPSDQKTVVFKLYKIKNFFAEKSYKQDLVT